MRKGTIILLIIAAALTLIGGAIFTVGFAAGANEGESFVDAKYQNKTYGSDDEIKAIDVKSSVAYIKLLPYDKEGYLVKCFEEKNAYHSVSVKDGVLSIELQETRAWYDFISFFSKPTHVTVYIPAGNYDSLTISSDTGEVYVQSYFTFNKADVSCSTGDVGFLASTENALSIKTSTGNVSLGNGSDQFTHGNVSLTTSTGNVTAKKLSLKDFTISVTTGKTNISDVTCDSLRSTGNTGNISMSNLLVKGTLSVNRSTGDVTFDKCDAAELYITTDTGDVRGSLLSPKIFLYDTDTGDVSLPGTTTGGKCKITTDTGDISFSIVN